MFNMQRLLLIGFLLVLQSCQLISENQPPIGASTPIFVEQQQIYQLFRLGELYSDLDQRQQQSLCKKLIEDYQQQADWQSAWLLVFSLNQNFSCLNLNKSLKMLTDIQTKQETDSPLSWLNKNQLLLLNKQKNLQSKKNRFYRKNLTLQKQLNETETQLQDVIYKIQALKAIETNINRKLDTE